MTESLQRQSACRKVATDERGVHPAIYGPGSADPDGKSSQLAHDQNGATGMSDMAGDAVKVTVERSGKLPRYNCSGDVFGVDLLGCFETGVNGANGVSDMAGKAAR